MSEAEPEKPEAEAEKAEAPGAKASEPAPEAAPEVSAPAEESHETEPAAAKPKARPIESYLALFEFGVMPRSKAGWAIRFAVTLVGLVILSRRVAATTAPLLSAKPPASIPTEEIDDYRFKIPERTRREIFADLATAELSERARAIAQNTWSGHLWSREDDRGHYERVAARTAAAKYRISLTQVYLVLDEGIRERWPGPDGKPLPATTPPLNIRQSW